MKFLAAAFGALCLVLAAGALATFVIARRVEARFPPAGRFVEAAAGRLHVLEAGPRETREAVLLLHGASGSAAEPMRAIGARLPADLRVLALDRPGHGWSERLDGAAMASPARQAGAIVEALDRLGVDRAVVVGHSWAGALALNLALDHPERVSGLVLLAPVSHPWPGGTIAWYYGPATSSLVGWLFTRTLTTPLGRLALPAGIRAVFAPQPPPPDFETTVEVPLVLRPRTFEANAQDVAGLFAFVTAQSGRYGAIRAPTVIVSGDADPIVWTNLHSRSLAREISGAKLVVLPGVGHMPHHAAGDLVSAEIAALARPRER